MVLEITVKREAVTDDEHTYAYTVHVESNRILTIFTASESVLNKWLKQVVKSSTNRPSVLVGVAADSECLHSWRCKNIDDQPYDFLYLNIGSHSLIYELYDDYPKSLISFFANPKVFAVGCDMAKICKKLKVHNKIEIRNAVDVNDLAVRGLKRDDLDLGRYGLDRLAMTVLGKEMDVVRPEKVMWYESDSPWGLTGDKVKFSTVDVYLCYLIGLELIDAIDGAAGPKNNKKKNKKI